MNSFSRAVPFALALAAGVGAVSCGGVGKIGDRTGAGAALSGEAGSTDLPPAGSGAAGASPPATGSSTGTAASGDVTGAAGAGDVTGGAGDVTGSAAFTGGGGSVATGTTGTGGASASGAGGSTTSAPDAGTTAAKDAGTTSLAVTMPFCKRGEAYQSNSLADLQTLSKGISWWYNWTTSPEKGVATTFQQTGVEFVPMIWGVQGGPPDPATIEKQIPKSAKYILGFNEPNFASQANITATQAAALWPRIMQIAKDMNLKIGSPAPNYCAGACNDTDPIHYLDTFFAACTGCQVDFIAAHWYACTGDALTHYLGLLKKYNKPIWLTEFSCMDAGDHSAAGEQTYMKTALQILENDPTIFRYSWFTGRWTDPTVDISLLGGDGQLTDLGNLYVTSAATNVCGQ